MTSVPNSPGSVTQNSRMHLPDESGPLSTDHAEQSKVKQIVNYLLMITAISIGKVGKSRHMKRPNVPLRKALVIAALIVVILAASFVLMQAAGDFPADWKVDGATLSMGQTLRYVLFGLIFSTIAVLVALAATWWSSPWDSPIISAFVTTVPVIPGIAAAATVGEYLVLSRFALLHAPWAAVLGGMGTALYIWLLLALLYRRFVSVECANPRSYHLLRGRLDALIVQLKNFKPSSPLQQRAYDEACAHRDFIARAFGQPPISGKADTAFHWISGTGYINLWNRLHRAEEALIHLEPVETVIGGAHYDQWRIRRSGMENRDELLQQLEASLKSLNETRKAEHPPVEAMEAEKAQAILREVRCALNEYRDDRWEGLVRARNKLTKTGTFTSLFGYTFLSLAIVVGAGTQAIIAAAVVYLVGASVGLLNQLLAEANAESAIDDYGLSAARLLHIPLFSGLAALGGVVLMTMLSGGLNAIGSTSITPPAASSGSVASLRDIFDLGRYPFRLIIAAIFGLTPQLLIDQLKKQTNRYTEELKATQPTEGTKSAAG